MLGERRTRELIELRHGLEVQVARLAAERGADEHVDRLRVFLAGMWDNLDNLDNLASFVEADRDFHLEIGAAAGNVVLRDLLQNVRSLLRVWTERVLRDEVLAEITYAEHVAVFRAISGHDPAAAGAAMAAHMDSAGARLLHGFETTATPRPA
jgi:GntR family transcriptional regulator, transcriptional repressor for pyruvate dehydrogenase complex